MFFRGDFNGTPPQRRSHTHTHTHTPTHMTVQRWMRGQVVPDFRVFVIFIFDPVGQKIFRPPGGHAIYENIISKEKLFFLFMLVFFKRRHYAANVFDD